MKKLIILLFLPLIAFSYITTITTYASTVAYGTNSGKLYAITHSSSASTVTGFFQSAIYGLTTVNYFQNNVKGLAFFNMDGQFYVVAVKNNQFIVQYRKKIIEGIKEIQKIDRKDSCDFYILTISDKIYILTFHKDIYTYTYEANPVLSFDNITEGFLIKDGYLVVYDVSGNIFFYNKNLNLLKRMSVMEDIRKLFLYKGYLLGLTGDGNLFKININKDYTLQFYLHYGKDLLYAFGDSEIYTIFNKDKKTYMEKLKMVHGTYLDYISPIYTKKISDFKTYAIDIKNDRITLAGESKIKKVRCSKDGK